MSTLSDTIITGIGTLIGGGVGWFWANIKTGRQKRESDVDLVNRSIAPLLKSIAELSGHVRVVTSELVQMTNERTELLKEISDLRSQIQQLEKKVAAMSKLLNKKVNE